LFLGDLKGYAVVRVDIEDCNDNAPTFSPIHFNISLRTMNPFNEPVVRVFAKDADSDKHGVVSYEITSGNEEDSFRIDSRTGEVYVRSKLFPTIYQLKIQAKDSGGLVSSILADVIVTVLTDEFPNPSFDQRMYEFHVREDAKPGTLVGRVSVQSSNILTYSIADSSPEDLFVIDRFTGTILVERPLDFETEQMIVFGVKASVENEPGCNYTQVVIIVEDANDNVPVFESSIDTVWVSEDQNTSVPFYTLKARDRDSGTNGALIYGISVNPDNMFVVQPLSGELRITRRLHYEHTNNYRLVVSVRDSGVPPRSAEMALKVLVLDANDHAPHFSHTSYHLSVPENAAVTSHVFQLIASDKDTGINGKISYGIQQQSNIGDDEDMAHFGIFSDTGWVYVRRALDREKSSQFTFRVFAKDNGRPSHLSTAEITVTVTDVNDNAPRCEGVQKFSVTENQGAGFLVGKITAYDPDQGLNGTVHYFLNDSSSAFSVNTDGEIYVSGHLDRERQPQYDLDVVLMDGGSPSLKGLCHIQVVVEDVNDNSPVFVLPLQMKVFLREEQNKGVEVLQAQARDSDLGENGTVRYEIRSPADGLQLPFTIDSLTGIVTTTRVVDYESDAKFFEIDIVAKDLGKAPKSAVKRVIIEVVDVDDDGGVPENETVIDVVVFEVSEEVEVGTSIGLIDRDRSSTVDVQAMDEQTLRKMVDVLYDIVAGNSFGLFDVDRFTSELFVVKNLDYELSDSHFLKISRTNASSRLPSVQFINVKVYVADENDNWPWFVDDPVIFSIPENARLSSSVWTFNATDKDAGSFGRVEYDIVRQNPENAFLIDQTTGELILAEELDHEQAPMHLVIVRATDQAPNVTNRKSATVTTRIYVIDVNDNHPRFESNDSCVFYEGSLGTEPILYVVAKDDDWMDNARLSYSIQVTVMATDHGDPPLSSTQTITVEFKRVSGLAPFFKYAVFTANVTENCAVGTEVTTLEVLTTGQGSDAELNFTLFSEDGDQRFIIDSHTGLVRTAESIDREMKDKYTLTAIVRSSNYPDFYDSAVVVVNVADINDNAPILIRQLCDPVVEIRENIRVPVIKRVIAVDPDQGENGKIFYSIAGGNQNGDFHIDSSTGTLSCQPLDRERQQLYNLTILATDSGSVRHSDSCTVVVKVLDENDNDPVFEKSNYAARVREDVTLGSVVVTVKAKDADDGLNAKIIYSLVNETSGLFAVRPNTGEIVTLRPLNFEVRDSYTLKIKAVNMGLGRRHSQTATVTVQVIDVNDNSPVFQDSHSFVHVSSKILPGQRVAKVKATDADGPGPNSELHYSLLRHSPFFNINPDTGVISATKEISQMFGTVVHLLITASDKGIAPRNATSVMTILMSDDDDDDEPKEQLIFDHELYEANMSEHMKSQSVTATLRAHSQSGSHMQVTYQIVAGNGSQAFTIDPSQG
uniref:MSP domain-containing protein n=1 Tax=Soboliphyme baturini TaxID=241478 RepID=A0A183IV92_9BILA